MTTWQRVFLGGVAAVIQLVGFFILVRFTPTSDFRSFIPILLGFYASSWLGLALGEAAVGVSSGRRKLLIGMLPTAGLIGLLGSASMVGLVGGALALNLAGSWLLGRGWQEALDTRLPRESAENGAPAWRRTGARLLAALAAGFVLWQTIVDSVRIRYAVEARIIGEARTLIAAQEAYAALNSGFYDTPECLQAPSRCLQTALPPGIVFLGPEPWSGNLRYYRRRFIPGPGVDSRDRPPGASSSSMRSYAYVGVPAEPDGLRGFIRRMAGQSLAGARAICADSTGRICLSDGAAEPRIVDGICAPNCQTP